MPEEIPTKVGTEDDRDEASVHVPMRNWAKCPNEVQGEGITWGEQGVTRMERV